MTTVTVEYLDPARAADADAVAALHLEHLPDSPIVLLGRRFLRDFYYGDLVRDGLIECVVGRAEGRVVGFISYTDERLRFMTTGIRRHFVRLSWLMLRELLARPAMVKDILYALRLIRERRLPDTRAADGPTAEVLSLVAMREYQTHVPAGGRSRLTVRMFETMVERLREQGLASVYLLVLPSNRASNLFCASMGCQFEKITQVGAAVHRYTYFLDEPPAEPATGTPS